VAIVVALNAAVYMYMLGVKPWLEVAGVLCPRHTLTELSDWVMVVLIAVASLGMTKVMRAAVGDAPHGRQARLRARLQFLSRVLLALAVLLSAAKQATLMFFHGLCALPEFAWCGIFISFGLSIHLVRPAVAELEVADMEVVKSEVARVMADLSTSTWSDEGADGNLESGNSVACSICLGDLEPGDIFKTTPCNHSFHESCLQKWLLASMCKWKAQSCAVCRRDLRCDSGLADAERPPSVGDRS
jgi:hypothetical protein